MVLKLSASSARFHISDSHLKGYVLITDSIVNRWFGSSAPPRPGLLFFKRHAFNYRFNEKRWFGSSAPPGQISLFGQPFKKLCFDLQRWREGLGANGKIHNFMSPTGPSHVRQTPPMLDRFWYQKLALEFWYQNLVPFPGTSFWYQNPSKIRGVCPTCGGWGHAPNGKYAAG